MGQKDKRNFGTVLALAALFSGQGWLGVVAKSYSVAIAVAAVTYGAWAARDARRRAQSAAGAALEDRKQMLRGGAVAKSIVYGQAWMSGVIVYVREAKSKEDPFFWLVLALPIAHEIEAIEEVWFGDQPICTPNMPLDANGFPTSGTFLKRMSASHVHTGRIPDGNVIPAPGGPELAPGEVIQVYGMTCAVYPDTGGPPYSGDSKPEEDLRRDVNAYLLDGTRDQIYIPGTVGENFVLTYQYYWHRPYVRVWRYTGTQDQVANTELIAAVQGASPTPSDLQWNPACKLTGIPYLVLKMHVDPDIFPRDLENVTVRVKGKNDILDTRTGVAGYHENSMLVARDYAVTQCGVLPGEIHLDKFHAEVNACEETITEPNTHPDRPIGIPVTTYRYTTHAVLATEVPPVDNLGLILSSCDGSAVWSGPSFDLRCGRYEEPLVVLDDSDLAGPVEIIKSPNRMELFNAVRGRFVNSDKRFWPLEDSSGYYSDYYRQQDGGDPANPEDKLNVMEIDLPATVYPMMAQRIQKQILHRSRSALRIRAVFDIKALQLSPEQTVWLSLRSLGMTEKICRVKSMKPVDLSKVEMDLQEDGPLLYEWDFDEASGVDPAPNSDLPMDIRKVPLLPFLVDTSASPAAFGPDGELTPQARVYWNEVQDILVRNGGHIEIRYKRSQDLDWRYSPALLPTSTEFRFPIRRNDFLIVEGRCANALVRGEWTQQKKLADDTPTEYLSSNRLANSRLVGPTSESATAAMTGWDNPIGQGSTVVESGGYRLFKAHQQADTGVRWVMTGASGGQVSYAYSRPIAVIPGTRLAASVVVSGYPLLSLYACDVGPLIVFYDSNGVQGSVVSHSDKFYGLDPAFPASLGYEYMKRIEIMTTVPSGAVLARLVIKAEASGNGLSTDQVSAAFYQPYLGPASDGQVSAPPWVA